MNRIGSLSIMKIEIKQDFVNAFRKQIHNREVKSNDAKEKDN